MKQRQYFDNILGNQGLLNADSLVLLKDLVDEYPYCQVSRILYILNLRRLEDFTFSYTLPVIAIQVQSRKRLKQLVENVAVAKKGSVDMVDTHKQHSTSGATFVNKTFLPKSSVAKKDLKKENNKAEEDIFLERLRTEALMKIQGQNIDTHLITPNNSKKIAEVSASNKIEQSKTIIDRFIEANPSISKIEAGQFSPESATREYKEKASLAEDYTLVTESLADLFASQGAIQKAILIYQNLSKIFPEKRKYYSSKIETIKKS